MGNEFIPYEEALALKELGFDEPCLAYYNKGELFSFTQICNEPLKGHYIKMSNRLCTPLYQQAFRWFREKHDVEGFAIPMYNFLRKDIPFEERKYQALILYTGHKSVSGNWNTPEEAELACIRKLIEHIKPKQR
jgi:hypothetical protein